MEHERWARFARDWLRRDSSKRRRLRERLRKLAIEVGCIPRYICWDGDRERFRIVRLLGVTVYCVTGYHGRWTRVGVAFLGRYQWWWRHARGDVS